MTLLAVVGDGATTTAIALAAAWPATDPREPVVVEADATGGSLAAWFDVPLSPSLSSVVTALHHAESDAGWDAVRPMIRRDARGVAFVPAPFRRREASTAVAQAERLLWPACGDLLDTVVIADVGSVDPDRLPDVVRRAEFVLVGHRQHDASPPAATVRIERLAEQVDAVSAGGARPGIVLVGEQPFGLREIRDFVAPDLPGWTLPVDPLSAAVLAGRPGVSERRLVRLPLMRAASVLAADLAASVGPASATTTDAGLDPVFDDDTGPGPVTGGDVATDGPLLHLGGER